MQTTLFGIVSIILGWLCFAHVHGCSRWQHECTSVTHTRSSALPERHPDCALVLSAWHDSDLHRSHRNPIDPGSAQHAALTDSSAHVRITSAMVKALIPCTSYSRDAERSRMFIRSYSGAVLCWECPDLIWSILQAHFMRSEPQCVTKPRLLHDPWGVTSLHACKSVNLMIDKYRIICIDLRTGGY